MNYRNTLTLSAVMTILLTLGCSKTVEEGTPNYPTKLTDLVDPWIGTGGHGHVSVSYTHLTLPTSDLV